MVCPELRVTVGLRTTVAVAAFAAMLTGNVVAPAAAPPFRLEGDTPVMDPAAPPVFVTITDILSVPVAPLVHETDSTEMLAVVPKVPNNRKANPAIATPATSVMAISITVASTSEIPTLSLKRKRILSRKPRPRDEFIN
jgi:hypothetical protein